MNKKLQILLLGLEFIGARSIFGPQNNSIVTNFFKKFGFGGIKNDDTAWCSAFVGAILNDCGIRTNANLMARSWLSVFKETNIPVIGDLCVLWRESPQSVYGHVGIYIRKTESHVYLLGGNQGNMVSICAFPVSQIVAFLDPTLPKL